MSYPGKLSVGVQVKDPIGHREDFVTPSTVHSTGGGNGFTSLAWFHICELLPTALIWSMIHEMDAAVQAVVTQVTDITKKPAYFFDQHDKG